MRLKCISLENILYIIDSWLAAGGEPIIELGALEPLLWKDKDYDISDLIKIIKTINHRQKIIVNLTTNGYLLSKYAQKLKSSHIDKIRVSWHSCNERVFNNIAGVNAYSAFMKGLNDAIDLKLPISINRILFANYINDLDAQLDFIEKNDLTIKLYDLYWTPENQELYNKFYIHWREPIEKYVLHRVKSESNITNEIVRSRKVFRLKNGGKVVVKETPTLSRDIEPCSSCKYKEHCLECYGDYLRIDSNLAAFPCYLRRDLSIQLLPINGDNAFSKISLHKQMKAIFKNKLYYKESRLRFILVPFCNFNCCYPMTDVSFCLKKSGDYIYPKRKPGLTNE